MEVDLIEDSFMSLLLFLRNMIKRNNFSEHAQVHAGYAENLTNNLVHYGPKTAFKIELIRKASDFAVDFLKI